MAKIKSSRSKPLKHIKDQRELAAASVRGHYKILMFIERGIRLNERHYKQPPRIKRAALAVRKAIMGV
jgi:hypothetical protein